MARVTTYLNFSRNTEEAFLYYKSIFGGEFIGGGILRFNDVPQAEDLSPIAEEDKNLIMHIELPILGGHVLMGRDAPESFGFNLNFGNNIHINLEPDSLEETKRLFHALSDCGIVTMKLQSMFRGEYFGSCTDKYGVQWMFNFAEKSGETKK
jgi:PhnB protein